MSHATGQRIALAHRITEIRTEVADEPVRTTTLTYARSIEAPSSRLATIATAAADGAALEIPGATALDPTAEGRAWVDVDGDALADLLDAEPGAWRFHWLWLQLRDGAGYEPAEAVLPPPAGMRLGDPGVQLSDMNGDRISDLVLAEDSRILVAGLGIFEDPADMFGAPAMTPPTAGNSPTLTATAQPISCVSAQTTSACGLINCTAASPRPPKRATREDDDGGPRDRQ